MFLPTLRNDFGKVVYFPVNYNPGCGYLELGKNYDVENYPSEIQGFFTKVKSFKLDMTSNTTPAPFSCSTTMGAFSGSLLGPALCGKSKFRTQSGGSVTLDCGGEDKYFMDSFGIAEIGCNITGANVTVDAFYANKGKSIRIGDFTNVKQGNNYIVANKFELGVTGFSKFVFDGLSRDFMFSQIILSEGRGGNPNLSLGPQVINGDTINNYKPYLCITKNLSSRDTNRHIL